jgi:CRP-like cAMP-binding protein
MSLVAEDFQGESKTPSGLPKIPLFSDLSADAFIELFDRCPLRRFGMGERILEQGSVGDSFFVICAGAVRILRLDESGEQQELAVLQEGAFFGEMALLSGAPRTASVVSHAEETQLLEISATVLAQLSHRYPQVAAALKKFCRQRLLANVMNSSPLFKPFGRKDRKELVERFRARDVKKNDLIIKEGVPTDGLYVVLSGEVEVRKGKTHLATLREGEVFGEISLLQRSPATASVSAAKRTSLLRLPREAFDQVILTHPQVLQLVSELSESRQKATQATLSGELLV